MTDIVARIASRIHDAPMPTEHLLDEAAAEIERLRKALEKIGKGGFPGASYIAREALAVPSTESNTP